MVSSITTFDPSNGRKLTRYPLMTEARVEEKMTLAALAQSDWGTASTAERSGGLKLIAEAMRKNRSELADIATTEMGKPISEALAEIDKCIWCLQYTADIAPAALAEVPVEADGLQASIAYEPLGTILAIMPWNYPFWQVIRATAAAMVAGNTVVLKHADNVTGCGLALERLISDAGLPVGTFTALVIDVPRIGAVIADERVAGVTITGSARAGRAVAAAAGSVLKPTVLELGGSDPFIILDDADLDAAAACLVRSRYQNAGQACIAAKRAIVAAPIYDQLRESLLQRVAELRIGDPRDEKTQVGPLARADLRDLLDEQVRSSIAAGARLLIGGSPIPGHGFFYQPTVIEEPPPEAPAACEELFGPALALFRVPDDDAAVALANDTEFGLGSSVWTADASRARSISRRLHTGHTAINGLTASDPRLPFGGIRSSGYGRELADSGIRAFVNIHTVTTNVR